MPKLSPKQIEKLEEIYKTIATPEEIDDLISHKKLDTIQESVKDVGSFGKIIEGLKEFFNKRIDEVDNKVKKIKPIDISPILDALKENNDKIGNIKLQERVDKDYSPAYKLMIEKLSSLDEGFKGWKFPQYAYTGIRNKSFSPIDPANNGIGIPDFDSVQVTYTGLDPTMIVYTLNGNTVATLTATYSNHSILTLVRT